MTRIIDADKLLEDYENNNNIFEIVSRYCGSHDACDTWTDIMEEVTRIIKSQPTVPESVNCPYMDNMDKQHKGSCNNVTISDYKQVASTIYGLDNNESLVVTKFGYDKFIISKPKRIHQYGIWYSAESDPPKETGTYIGYSTSFSVTPVFYDAKDNQWETYDGDYLDDVTKWMPLPEPPKGKDNEVDQR